MRLRDVEFGAVWDASGVRSFFGEGYRHHRYLRPFGLRFDGATFVAKTTTLDARAGNMPLRNDGITPAAWKPRCIVVQPWHGIVLNAVGLSGPGAAALLALNRWQQRTTPFVLSFMSVAATVEARWRELDSFVHLLAARLPSFRAPVALQMNFSCPNVGVRHTQVVEEVHVALGIAAKLKIPLIPKLSVETTIAAAHEIANHPLCDALCVSNTIPFGHLPNRIRWQRYFGYRPSPLHEFGGGALSGRPLLPLVAEWVHAARAHGIQKPINAGGGILAPRDVDVLHMAGASSVFLGSIAILRPWRIAKTIAYANRLRWME